MCDFRMELNTIPRLLVVSNGCEWSITGGGDSVEIGGNGGEMIGVGHPDLEYNLSVMIKV